MFQKHWFFLFFIGGWFLSSSTFAQNLFELKSHVFLFQKKIPVRYTRDFQHGGKNISPPLYWKGTPKGTKSFVLICDDPDAPSPKHPAPKPWVHWIVYRIASQLRALPKKVLRNDSRFKQGTNSFANIGFDGPQPPPGSGIHRYRFTLYALDWNPVVPMGLTRKGVEKKLLKGHVLKKAILVGTYGRK